MKGPADGEAALIMTIAECTRAVMAGEEFDVSVENTSIMIVGTGEMRGRTNVMTPVFIWRAPLDVDERLRLVFESYGRRLQEYLTKAYGRPWPARGAATHVIVTDLTVQLWWGGSTEETAVREFGWIDRERLGL